MDCGPLSPWLWSLAMVLLPIGIGITVVLLGLGWLVPGWTGLPQVGTKAIARRNLCKTQLLAAFAVDAMHLGASLTS